MKNQNTKNIAAVIVIVAGIAAWAYIKVDAYGGDVSCLFARCVKLK